MKVKVLSRNPDDYLRETKLDIHKVPRNFAPELHPMQECREYVRALNATKLERIFAKPFVGNLAGHHDSVATISKHPKQLATLLSGSADGVVKIWNVAKQEAVGHIQAHSGFVRGIGIDPNGHTFFTVGDDKSIKQWQLACGSKDEPVMTILTKHILMDISHHWKTNTYATCGETVHIWDHQRAAPVREFNWGVDSVHKIRFNPVETELLIAAASDRSTILYDCRGQTPLRKVTMKLRSNALAWNPMEPFIFTAASEDYNLYTFDLRKLTVPVNVHMDHTAAVMDVDYAPTGREFVSGSYDKTIRIFPCDKGRSREVYHAKRMQRVMCVSWSMDNKFIFSGSDEMNIRIWKAKASEKLGPMQPREVAAANYSEKLKEKFAAHPEVRRIARHRQVPKHIFNAQKELRVMSESKKRKEANRRAHSKPGSVPFVSERMKHTLTEEH